MPIKVQTGGRSISAYSFTTQY